MIDTLWFHNGKTAAKAQELGLEGFGRLVCDIHLAAGRNDLEYLAQFDFVRTSDPGVEHRGDTVYPNGDCDAGQTSIAAGCGSGVLAMDSSRVASGVMAHTRKKSGSSGARLGRQGSTRAAKRGRSSRSGQPANLSK